MIQFDLYFSDGLKPPTRTSIQSLPGRFVEKSVDVETFQSAAGPPTSSDVTMKERSPEWVL